ncbi:MAG TPA: hypothetical protein VLI05_02950 [Candidatus Saccharimonadia bacterium]|nr:hypothetical protein [Candidatus Saccharimonadia bacterium]
MDESGPDPTFAIDGKPRLMNNDSSEVSVPGSSVTLVYNSDPYAVCGGGQPITECATAKAVLNQLAAILSHRPPQPSPKEGVLWNNFPRTDQDCATCGQSCSLAVQTNRGLITGRLRFGFVRRNPNADVVRLDLPLYDKPKWP